MVCIMLKEQAPQEDPKITRARIARTFGSAYVIGLLLTGFLLAAPPGKLVFYVILGLLAVIMAVVGLGRLRIVGVVFILLAVVLSVREFRAGKEFEDRIRTMRANRNP